MKAARENLTGVLSPHGRAERILEDLKQRVARRIPQWSRRGPEDPGWVLLEVFADALAERNRAGRQQLAGQSFSCRQMGRASPC